MGGILSELHSSRHKELHLGLKRAEFERMEEIVERHPVFLRMPPDVACMCGIRPTLARHIYPTFTPQA